MATDYHITHDNGYYESHFVHTMLAMDKINFRENQGHPEGVRKKMTFFFLEETNNKYFRLLGNMPSVSAT